MHFTSEEGRWCYNVCKCEGIRLVEERGRWIHEVVSAMDSWGGE